MSDPRAERLLREIFGRPRYFCEKCGKYITATKDGNYRHHRGHRKEYPGSPWNEICPNAGKPIEA